MSAMKRMRWLAALCGPTGADICAASSAIEVRHGKLPSGAGGLRKRVPCVVRAGSGARQRGKIDLDA